MYTLEDCLIRIRYNPRADSPHDRWPVPCQQHQIHSAVLLGSDWLILADRKLPCQFIEMCQYKIQL
jgi:hypothetical protein